MTLRSFLISNFLKPLWRIFVRPFASETLETKFIYWVNMGKPLNLKDPEDFNEKLQWLKLNWKDPLISECADKYAVRKYVEANGCGDVLNELYGVYSETIDIPWESLPDKFVLKCTHGCGYNIICTDKRSLDKRSASDKIERWMRSRYGLCYAEYHYLSITPRIICERYIETPAGITPNDYKIFCFNGKPHYVAVGIDRATDIKWHFLDMEWDHIDITLPDHNKGNPPVKPACWDRMVEVAIKLSQPFPFVRVDLYDDNGRAVFGEMTFTPAACMNQGYYSKRGLIYVGGLLSLPQIKYEDRSG